MRVLITGGAGLVGSHAAEYFALKNPKIKLTLIGDGEITSGSFSPTLGQSVALARVPAGVKLGDKVEVDLRGKLMTARVVKYPFVRNGKSCIETNERSE